MISERIDENVAAVLKIKDMGHDDLARTAVQMMTLVAAINAHVKSSVETEDVIHKVHFLEQAKDAFEQIRTDLAGNPVLRLRGMNGFDATLKRLEREYREAGFYEITAAADRLAAAVLMAACRAELKGGSDV